MTHSGKEIDFRNFILKKIKEGVKLNKRDAERFAAQFDISDKNAVKELCELAIVFRARDLAHSEKPMKGRYDDIVKLYRSQVNLSHRTSQSVMLQQYSTPAPIAFLAGSFVYRKSGGAAYFEPSAGNGLLTIALPANQTTVNEIDEFRSKNLAEQLFMKQLRQDATEPFGMNKMFEGIITNPPFGKLDKTITVDSFPINTLDHVMAIRALDCMKDDGRAAIIIGGHTEWDSEGRIKAGKNRIFFSYLYRNYRVSDVINIDGDLYSRQGTSFDVRLILIDGRKAKPEGYPPLKDANDTVVKDLETLFRRVENWIDARVYENIKSNYTGNETFRELIQKRYNNWLHDRYIKNKPITKEQKWWLNMICEHIQTNLSIKPQDLQLAPFNKWGGAAKYFKLFGDQWKEVLNEMNLLVKDERLRIAKAKAKLKLLNLLNLDVKGINGCHNKRILSAYTKVENCVDLADCRSGSDEIAEAIEWRKRHNMNVPDFYYTRLKKIMDKIDEFVAAEERLKENSGKTEKQRENYKKLSPDTLNKMLRNKKLSRHDMGYEIGKVDVQNPCGWMWDKIEREFIIDSFNKYFGTNVK